MEELNNNNNHSSSLDPTEKKEVPVKPAADENETAETEEMRLAGDDDDDDERGVGDEGARDSPRSSTSSPKSNQESNISDIPEGYAAYTDSKSGKQYYYNPETKETIWAPEKKPEWAKEGEKSAGHLNDTEAGNMLRSGDGNLAKPITNLDHLAGHGGPAEEDDIVEERSQSSVESDEEEDETPVKSEIPEYQRRAMALLAEADAKDNDGDVVKPMSETKTSEELGQSTEDAEKEAARLAEEEAKRKEEERKFWAEEEARLKEQAEQRKREKEERLRKAMEAEAAAKQKAQEEADAKAAEEARLENERLEKAKAKKEAALEAEKLARMKAEEERNYYQQEEEQQMNEGMEKRESRKRASLMMEGQFRSHARAESGQQDPDENEDTVTEQGEETGRDEEEEARIKSEEEATRLKEENETDEVDKEIPQNTSIDEIIEEAKEAEQEIQKKVQFLEGNSSPGRFQEDEDIVVEPEVKFESSSSSSAEHTRFNPDEDVVSEPLTDHKSVARQNSATSTLPNTVALRLEHAREKKYVPGEQDWGSNLDPLCEDFLDMKVHLNLMVMAAQEYHLSAVQLQDARSNLFQELADFSSDTPLKAYVEYADKNEGSLEQHPDMSETAEDVETSRKSLAQEYRSAILQHAKEWQETVSSMVDSKLAEYKALEKRYGHYRAKTARLRRYSDKAENLNLSFAVNKVNQKLERNDNKMENAADLYTRKADELCFLLEQVISHGWKDLYPLVKSSMEWENVRFEKEQAFGVNLPKAVERLSAAFPVLEEEELKKPQSFFGTTEKIQDELPKIDPSKPTLFLDDACPFTARVWITLLEKEVDPFNPTGFQIIPVCSVNPRDSGFMLLSKLGIESSPFLMHKGSVFSESTRVAEYLDQTIQHPLYETIPSLKPSDPIDVFNMRTFIDRHAGISDIFFNLMDCENDSAKPGLAKKLFDFLGLIDEDLRTFNGPYLLGKDFSLADINVFPFVEHIQVILSSFGSFSIPKSLSALLEWYDLVSNRPSVQVVIADRGLSSDQERTNSFKSSKRNEYLIEYHQYRVNFGRETDDEFTSGDDSSYFSNSSFRALATGGIPREVTSFDKLEEEET